MYTQRGQMRLCMSECVNTRVYVRQMEIKRKQCDIVFTKNSYVHSVYVKACPTLTVTLTLLQ